MIHIPANKRIEDRHNPTPPPFYGVLTTLFILHNLCLVMALRTCIKCGLASDNLELFSKGKGSKYGRMNICLDCKATGTRQYYQNHIEERLEYSRKRRAENPEYHKESYSRLVNRIGAGNMGRPKVPVKTRRQLLLRANNQCEYGKGTCKGKLAIHHNEGDSNELDNLTLLCHRHHARTHRLDRLTKKFTP